MGNVRDGEDAVVGCGEVIGDGVAAGGSATEVRAVESVVVKVMVPT